MTANPPTFPSFSDLPPELRSQVWHIALPDKIEPALFFYERGCWCPRRLSESDQGYDPDDDNNLVLEFRHDLLDHVQVKVPLVFVNREACRIARNWLLEQGIEMRFRKDRQYHVFVRPFIPMHDILYVALDKWDDFCSEPYDRIFQPDLINRHVSSGPDLTHIALSDTLLGGELAELSALFDWFTGLKTVTIIVDVADLTWEKNDEKVQGRWEIKNTQERAFCWNIDRASFDLEDDDGSAGNEPLYKRLKEASEELRDALIFNHAGSFKIQRAHAVRK